MWVFRRRAEVAHLSAVAHLPYSTPGRRLLEFNPTVSCRSSTGRNWQAFFERPFYRSLLRTRSTVLFTATGLLNKLSFQVSRNYPCQLFVNLRIAPGLRLRKNGTCTRVTSCLGCKPFGHEIASSLDANRPCAPRNPEVPGRWHGAKAHNPCSKAQCLQSAPLRGLP